MAEPSEVREWARGEGMEVSGRGAIPAHITDAYEAARPSTRKGWKNMWGQATAKTKTRSGTRTDLSEFAEDAWRDLAMLAGGIMPPVSKVLTIQAPYAGVVFDEAIRGLPIVDAVL